LNSYTIPFDDKKFPMTNPYYIQPEVKTPKIVFNLKKTTQQQDDTASHLVKLGWTAHIFKFILASTPILF